MTSNKLRFRGDLNFQNRIDELLDEVKLVDGVSSMPQKQSNESYNSKDINCNTSSNATKTNKESNLEDKQKKFKKFAGFKKLSMHLLGALSFLHNFKLEMTRGYILEPEEKRFTARRKKIYAFLRIPRDLERFMLYGLMQCIDSFLYIHTFLPVRFALAVFALVTRPLARCLGLSRNTQSLLEPAEICDLLKGSMWITMTLIMMWVDINMVYHIVKSQSIIKLYLFYNVLEVGDRLLSAFGQDTTDALFWIATERKNSKRKHYGLIPHILFALLYFALHSFLVMFQVTTLNVAINSSNKNLLSIMLSNNFVELKGSVFKKFDKKSLFQLTCSDVRERFHLTVLLSIVMLLTIKEFHWSSEQFYAMFPDCLAVIFSEILIDWIKHAFITRFNEMPDCIYHEYIKNLACDIIQTKQNHALSDHSDLLARKMGFMPLPLSVVLLRALYAVVPFQNEHFWIWFALVYIFILGLRICLTTCTLRKACKFVEEENHEENSNTSTPTASPNTSTVTVVNTNTSTMDMTGLETLPITPATTRSKEYVATTQAHLSTSGAAMDYALPKSTTADITNKELLNISLSSDLIPKLQAYKTNAPNTTSCSSVTLPAIITILPSLNMTDTILDIDVKSCWNIGSTPLFSTSNVNLENVKSVLDTTNSMATASGLVANQPSNDTTVLSLSMENSPI